MIIIFRVIVLLIVSKGNLMIKLLIHVNNVMRDAKHAQDQIGLIVKNAVLVIIFIKLFAIILALMDNGEIPFLNNVKYVIIIA